MTTPRRLERLFAVPPREFTRARNALAAELRQAGDAAGAREVSRLRRPSAPLWAVNQLARVARPTLERFLEAVERLRRTQLSDPRGAIDAMRKQREQLDSLVSRAVEALRDAGFSASPDATRRIATTLLGAAADPRHAVELGAGRLMQEPPAPGFETLTGAPARHLRVVEGGKRGDGGAGSARAGESERQREAARGARDTERARKAEAREQAAQERKRQAEERRRQAEERRREAEQRAAELAGLEREATAARERLAEIDRRLSEARRRVRATRVRGGGGRRRASPT